MKVVINNPITKAVINDKPINASFKGGRGPQGVEGENIELQNNGTHIQWRVVGAATWTNLIALVDLEGEDGTEIELQKTATHIQWRYVGGSWVNLISLAEITGPQGIQGIQGIAGADALWNFTGAYSIGASYAVGDIATYLGQTWYRINSNGGNTGDTPTEGTFWTLIAKDGDEIELQKGATHIQWRVVDAVSWINLISIADITGPAGTTDHGLLLGLGDDDHTQYMRLSGRVGGQTLIGGTGVTDMITLQGTSGNGTLTEKSFRVLVGNNGATEALSVKNNGYIDVAQRINFGTTTGAGRINLPDAGTTAADGLYMGTNLIIFKNAANALVIQGAAATRSIIFNPIGATQTITASGPNANNLVLNSGNAGTAQISIGGTNNSVDISRSGSPSLGNLLNLTGETLTGSSATSALSITQTWNTTGSPTAIFANITNTASGASANLMDLQVGGVSRFRVVKSGRISQVITGSTSTVIIGEGAGVSGSLATSYCTFIGATAGANTSTGAGNTFIGSGAGAGTTTGGSNIYIGRDSGSVNQTAALNTAIGNFAMLNHNTGTNNVCIGFNSARYLADGTTAATSLSNCIYLGNSIRVTSSGVDNEIIIGQNAVGNGSNTATWGNTLILNHYFAGKVNVVGTSLTGSSATSALSISQTWNTTGSPTAIFLNITNTASGAFANLMDLQVGGVSRLRVNRNGNIEGGGSTSITNYNSFSTSSVGFYSWGVGTRSTMHSPVNGNILFQNAALTDFDRLQFGGTTSSFPSIKRNAANLEFRLADDSGQTGILANNITFGTATGTGRINLPDAGTTAADGIAFGTAGSLFKNSSNRIVSSATFQTTNFLVDDIFAANFDVRLLSFRSFILNASTLTGSSATSALSISQTWNTTGNPTAILLNITNTASGATANLMDLQVGGSSQFRVTKEGIVSASSVVGTLSGTLTLRSNLSNVSGNYLIFDNNNLNITTTTSQVQHTRILSTYAPTSGTGIFNQVAINSTINQTGGANGITRGILIAPTLTSAADWRSIETNNNTGFALYLGGSADVFLNNDTDIQVGTTTGTKIGTSTSQKIGLWNATPIVQPTTAVAAAAFVANSGPNIHQTSTFDGYTVEQVVKALRNIGILA